MKRIIKDPKKRNRYSSDIFASSNSFESFKELLQKLKVLRHFEKSYNYLSDNPSQKIKDDSIKKILTVITERLFYEGMPMSTLAKLYSENISDNSLRTYTDTRKNIKAQSIVFAPIEAASPVSQQQRGNVNGYVIDKSKKIINPLEIQLMIKKDVRGKKSRKRIKKIKLNSR